MRVLSRAVPATGGIVALKLCSKIFGRFLVLRSHSRIFEKKREKQIARSLDYRWIFVACLSFTLLCQTLTLCDEPLVPHHMCSLNPFSGRSKIQDLLVCSVDFISRVHEPSNGRAFGRNYKEVRLDAPNNFPISSTAQTMRCFGFKSRTKNVCVGGYAQEDHVLRIQNGNHKTESSL